MSLLDDVIELGVELPDWQSDAVRRLLTQEEVSAQDVRELTAFLKKKHGIIDDSRVDGHIKPLVKGGISGAGGLENVTIKAMKGLRNVNMIPDGSSLQFAHEGLTIIYGENATGKSGYARVLKKACRARHIEDILPNVFSDSKKGPAKAYFKIGVNDKEYPEVEWIDGEGGDTILSNICVFDSKCARVIVNENNEISYLPYGADIFEKLVDLLLKMRQGLKDERPTVVSLEYPDITAGTEAAEFVSNLGSGTKDEEIEKATCWTETDEKETGRLNREVAKAEAEDPIKEAQKIRNLKGRISIFRGKLEELLSGVSDDREREIRGQVASFNAGKKAFEEASSEDFSREPLAGVGANEWEILYNAAKEYSTTYAYPDEEFPYIGENSLCVLCLQPLSEDARTRFERFKAFMEERTKKEFEYARDALNGTLEELRNLGFRKIKEFKDASDEINSRNPELGKFLCEDFVPSIRKRAAGLIRLARNKCEGEVCKTGESPKTRIEKIEGELEREAGQIEKNAKPEEISKLRTRREGLQARKILSQRKDKIVKYRQNLRLQKKYDACIRETDTTRITRKGREIISNALTPGLRKSLRRELNVLGAAYLPISVKARGDYGTTRHQIELEGCKSLSADLTDILSEGEQKIVAIAGFLAELDVCGHRNPIVFDDPVCSLDHKYSEKIAERLVEESARRQIVVLTHNIGFLLDVQTKCKSGGQYCHCVDVRREGGVTGVTRGGEPWHAMPVNRRLHFIEGEVVRIASLYQTDQQQYNKEAGILYGCLRETWEAAVEECLFNKVIRRFQAEVKTQSLREVTIEKSDCDAIEEGMSKCSKWMVGHSLSREISDNRPPPGELQEDVKGLRSFTEALKTRRKATVAMRQIPAPEIG